MSICGINRARFVARDELPHDRVEDAPNSMRHNPKIRGLALGLRERYEIS
jgi:hypothetical protein